MPISNAISRIEEIKTTIVELSPETETKAVATADDTKFAATLEGLTTGTSGTATGSSIVEEAKKYVGIPYVFGGEDPSGFDCSGLVQYVLKQQGIDAPRLAHEQATIGTEVKGGLANAQPGDLIVTNNSDHIVIYAGDGMVVHAPYEGRDVSYQKNWLTDSDIQTIRRVAPATAPATVSSQQSKVTAAQNALGQSTTSGSNLTDLLSAAQLSKITGKTS